ncbi:MAG: hypothetical protein BMS9Abin39_0659 [Ignavibacteria bacterium]|nr:MAG: hypothetical protein BMS9Abin39_0659 [Ignavibacteria bacterium]
MRTLYSILFFFFVLVLNSSAQNKMMNKNIFDTNPVQSFTKYRNDSHFTSEDQKLLNRISEIKKQGDVSKAHELKTLIKNLSTRNGLIEKQAGWYNGKIIFNSNKILHKPMSQNILIYTGNIKSFASSTEQTGSTKGRVWIAFSHGSLASGPDSLSVYWSDDGIDYSSYAFFILGGTDIFWQNEIDMEIIEKTDGSKFLWILYTYSNDAPFSSGKIGGMVLNLNQPEGTEFALNWPGQSNNENYYSVHLTSDNSVDSTGTWLYIACSMDSIGNGGNPFYAQKFAVVTQTSQTGNPSVLYRAEDLPVFWQSGDTYLRYLSTDIAYFRDVNNIPGLMFTYSNVPDSTKIWLSTSNIMGGSASFVGTLGGNYQISFSRIAAPGGIGNQQLMIVGTQNFQNSGDWNLLSWKTIDGGSTWDAKFIEDNSSTDTFFPIWPDIYSKWKDVNNYRVSYSLGSGQFWIPDSLMFVKSVNGNSNNWQTPVNVSDGTQFPSYPSIAFAGNSSNDCYILWSDANEMKLYSTSCASLVNVESDNLNAYSYTLDNNYPNPFNPSTTIRYELSSAGRVVLKVFDILGNKVATLVNEEKPAGSYQVRFEAKGITSGVYFYRLSVAGKERSYSETKKMILLR